MKGRPSIHVMLPSPKSTMPYTGSARAVRVVVDNVDDAAEGALDEALTDDEDHDAHDADPHLVQAG